MIEFLVARLPVRFFGVKVGVGWWYWNGFKWMPEGGLVFECEWYDRIMRVIGF